MIHPQHAPSASTSIACAMISATPDRPIRWPRVALLIGVMTLGAMVVLAFGLECLGAGI